jgi:NAD(P)-dependent dehydrogenase (short-subunit alcohol dehydrogenase family)
MKVAVVTGAAQGVGLATSLLLAESGYHVVMTDVQPLGEQLAQLRESGGQLSAISGDVSDPEFIEHLAQRVHQDNGGADLLVNNAGISLICPAEVTSLAQWQRMMAINLTAPFLLCQAFGKQMLEKGKGSIVNVASIAGLHGVIHRAAYNASKHGLVGLTRTLAAEWGGRGLCVNAVCPGWIKTEMDAHDMGLGAYNDEDIINRVPQGRFARPEEVARAILFLGEADGFINGVSLPVDGGWTGDASWDSLRLKARRSKS